MLKYKKLFIWLLFGVVAMGSMAPHARGEVYTVKGRPLNLLGYLTQGVAYGLGDDDDYDTEEGFQSAIFSLLLEGDYSFTDNLKLYAAGMYTVDWIYDFKHDDRTWKAKKFYKSRNRLYQDDEYWQVLKEIHLNWAPRGFFFRVGKQIVSWGETDGFRLMDQINPLDQRRGFADVEFETTIIPIWLFRAEYYPEIDTGWLTDLGLECIINPNADFIPSQPIMPGNNVGGIWAPDVMVQLLPIGPAGQARLGSLRTHIDEPNSWDSDGYEIGIRLKGILYDSIITLNYFDGLENDYVTRPVPSLPGMERASDGKLIIHPEVEGYYPDFRFVGATLSRDLQSIRTSLFGDVAPVLRIEALYAFESTFATSQGTLKKHDEFRWALGIDWKIKIRLLNPRAYFTISPQVFHRKIKNYPSRYELQNLEDDNYMTSLMLRTSYFNGKLVPSFFWSQDITNEADMYRYQIDYQYTHNWQFTLGALFLGGSEKGKGVQVFENKDQIYFSVSYRWG